MSRVWPHAVFLHGVQQTHEACNGNLAAQKSKCLLKQICTALCLVLMCH